MNKKEMLVFFVFIVFWGCCNFDQKSSSSTSENDSVVLVCQNIEQKSLRRNDSALFYKLIVKIDSLGYISDTVRYRKIYSQDIEYLKSPIYKSYYEYLVFDIPIKKTIPFLFNERKSHASFRYINSIDTSWMLDLGEAERYVKVQGYFFSSKNPVVYNSLKFYIDGIVEEWECKRESDAKSTAEEIAANERFVYLNRGAYICSKGKFIYIFHSRSKSFYNELKKIFNCFVAENNAKLPAKKTGKFYDK